VKAEHYFQKGFGLKGAVEGQLVRDYHSDLVVRLKQSGYRLTAGDLAVHLAREFGFCYGVDRAIDYAYEAREKFPSRRIFLFGEIIHNPGVNRRLLEMGLRFLTGPLAAGGGTDDVTAEDIVIIPAFGVTKDQMRSLEHRGCVMVDTTCGSVLNVWKRVERYAREGFTSVIHGKHYHEETQATASRAVACDGHHVVVRDLDETSILCDYLCGRGRREAFLERFRQAVSPGFDPDLHLARIGVANQTTMLMSESLAVAERIRQTLLEVRGPARTAEEFRSFDTICSATQERQDAVLDLLDQGVDVMIVIGGYNSSNTTNLARMCSLRVPTYHLETSAALADDGTLRYRPPGAAERSHGSAWLPAGPVRVGVTAGASTPDSEVGAFIVRLLHARGLGPADARFALASA
jgi:4-hydroxy-3-methylbut-2-enyl diphosphate reductase